MANETPPFWYQPADWRALCLWPASALYGVVAGYRMRHAPRAPIAAPVLCLGNLTVGGTGKTPACIAMAAASRLAGLKPGILSRGHGGGFAHPHLVDAAHDSARHVGDEPLLLAEHAPVAISPNRAAAAGLLLAQGCDFIIMDDGFQSARVAIDYGLIVVDGAYGLGNGHVIPGGPLRAPVVDQLRFLTGVLRMGKGDAANTIVRLAARAGRPVFDGEVEPRNGEAFAGKRLLAFAGIGHPDKFYATLAATGGEVVATRSFPDHHVFAPDELCDLVIEADRQGLQLATTAKDAARLRHGAAPQAFLDRLMVLEIDAVLETGAAERIIGQTLEAWGRRKLES